VAALKLGAASAIGVDIDHQALTASRDNAERNQVAERLALLAVDEPLTALADVLLANILAEPLLALASELKDRVIAGGRIALSGILSSQAAAVAERYAPWFDMNPATHQDGWVRLDGVRRATAA
jgi:ribosomal protein L11 methyltransferase